MQKHTYEILYKVEDTHWWFCGRRAILKSLLDNYLHAGNIQSRKILDLGCGTGRTLELLKDYGTVTGLDIASQALAFSTRRAQTNLIQADFTKLPIKGGSLDVITALDTLEHVGNDREVLKGIYRLLKPGGLTVLFVPAFPSLWGPQDDLSHHKRRYRLLELRKKVEEAGFVVERMTYINFFLFVPIWLGRKILKIFSVSVQSENNINAPGLNALLKWLFCSESVLLPYVKFPFGVSLIAIVRKP